MSSSTVRVQPQQDYYGRAVHAPLYDKTPYPVAGALVTTFFAIPVNVGGKSYADTNLQGAAKIGGGYRFHMDGIQFSCEQRTAAANLITIRNDWARITGVESGAVIAAAQNAAGLFRFGIGSVTSLLAVPVSLLPSGMRSASKACLFDGITVAGGAALHNVGLGESNDNEMFEFKMITIDPNSDPEDPVVITRRWQILSDETFNCSLEYQQGLVPLAAAILNLIVTLPGILVRAL